MRKYLRKGHQRELLPIVALAALGISLLLPSLSDARKHAWFEKALPYACKDERFDTDRNGKLSDLERKKFCEFLNDGLEGIPSYERSKEYITEREAYVATSQPATQPSTQPDSLN
jgi:hypothetical protein